MDYIFDEKGNEWLDDKMDDLRYRTIQQAKRIAEACYKFSGNAGGIADVSKEHIQLAWQACINSEAVR